MNAEPPPEPTALRTAPSTASKLSKMLTLKSGIRTVPPEVTLELARVTARSLGVSRVTDTTRLDRIGIPVFASVRPNAIDGSLCVNAGKGTRPIEAQVGAYMEAIEFAMAEPGAAGVEVEKVDWREILDARRRPEAIAELCPMPRKGVDPRVEMECVVAEEITERRNTILPAELVFSPFIPSSGQRIFGCSTNGLASGNTVTEATLHGLLEVIERDVISFHHVRDSSRLVIPESLPPFALHSLDQFKEAGCAICIRALPNCFGISVFETDIWDPASTGLLSLTGGTGCHLLPEIALMRAITEAAQSRLTVIHGGRDDLAKRAERFDDRGDRAALAAKRFHSLSSNETRVRYEEVRAPLAEPHSIQDALNGIIALLLEAGITQVCRVALAPPTKDLHVVRVVVPRLEYFERDMPRVGPRLYQYIYERTS